MAETDKNIVRATFKKHERIVHKKIIEELFKKGSSSHSYPFLLKFLPASDAEYHQVLISVSKKHFKRAVDRNLIKRRIREIYRKNKDHIYPSEQKLYIAILYIGKEIFPYSQMERKLIKLIKRLPIK